MGGWYFLIIQLIDAVEFGFKLPVGALTPDKTDAKD